MPRLSTLRATLLSTRDLIVTAGPFVLLVVGLLLLAYWVPVSYTHLTLPTKA